MCDALAEHILPREAAYRLFDHESDPRNQALLKLLYVVGLRVSEATGLRWRDLAERDKGVARSRSLARVGRRAGELLPPPHVLHHEGVPSPGYDEPSADEE